MTQIEVMQRFLALCKIVLDDLAEGGPNIEKSVKSYSEMRFVIVALGKGDFRRQAADIRDLIRKLIFETAVQYHSPAQTAHFAWGTQEKYIVNNEPVKGLPFLGICWADEGQNPKGKSGWMQIQGAVGDLPFEVRNHYLLQINEQYVDMLIMVKASEPLTLPETTSPHPLHIESFCMRLHRHAMREQRRIEVNADNKPHYYYDNERPLGAVTSWLATNAGLSEKDVGEYIRRRGGGYPMEQYTDPDDGKLCPDITHVVRRLNDFDTAGRFAELLARFCEEYPNEANEMDFVSRFAIGSNPAAVTHLSAHLKTQKASKGIPWQKAMKIAENHIARNPFPGVKALAKIINCSPSTISKAIDHSPKLRIAFAEHELRRKTVSDVNMSEAVSGHTPQSVEMDPVEAAARQEDKNKPPSTDDLLTRLMEAAKPSERAKLQQMPPEKLRELANLQAHDPEYHDLDETPRIRGRSR